MLPFTTNHVVPIHVPFMKSVHADTVAKACCPVANQLMVMALDL